MTEVVGIGLIEDYQLPRDRRALPVTAGGMLVGMVSVSDIRAVLPAERASMTVGAAMGGRGDVVIVRPDTPLSEALKAMRGGDFEQVRVAGRRAARRDDHPGGHRPPVAAAGGPPPRPGSRVVLERRVIEPGGVAELAPAWRELTERSARSPFESPAWLLPWLRHYGSAWRPRVVTWWRSGELVAVAPVAWRRRRGHGIPYRELTFWGWTETPLRGWVDIVADADAAVEVAADFSAWLEAPDQEWDLFNYLHLDPDSPTLAALTARRRSWWRVDLSPVLHSLEYVVALPEDASGWPGQLGPKARHEIRREMRLFERRLNGRIEEIRAPAASDEIIDTLASLMADRWGEREAYFTRDPRFRSFARDAAREALESGHGWALVARDPERTAACLLVLGLGRSAAAVVIGVSQGRHYRSMSLGKCLFSLAIEGAVARGCREFSLLTENGYKTVFWHAEGRPTASGFLGRGPIGRAIAASATARRVPDRLRHPFAVRRREYRP